MNKLKRFMSTTLVYFVGNVLSKLVVFFLLPLYTSRISPEQYGYYDLVLAFINLFAPIFFLQIWDGMFRVSFDYGNNADKYKVISNAYVVALLGTFVYSILFSVIQAQFEIKYSLYVFIYGIAFAFHYLYGYVCRVFLANKMYALSGLINTTVTAVLNIILIVKFNWDVKSLYFAPAIGMLVQILIIEIKFKTISKFRIKDITVSECMKLVRFSIPLCLSSVSYWLLSGFTKVLIAQLLGTADNGLFAVANKFSTATVLIITIFQYAWNELAYIMSNDTDRVKIYNICIDLLLKFALLGGAGICIFIKIIFPYIIHEQYSAALAIIPATILGSMTNSAAGFISTLFMTEKKTKEIMISTIIASGVNIILGFVCTKAFKLHGATISLAIAFTLLMLIRLFQAIKYFNIKIDFKQHILSIFVLVAAIAEYYISNSIILDCFAILIVILVFILSMKPYLRKLLLKH